ncbi:MAG: hypothetical protein KGS72_25590 [Cyanobacteria bacterium REEB67]|nr:hypothetical protein [Cyanobacteria bacterium REEB67]
MSHFQLQFPADRHDTAGDAFVDTSLGNAADAARQAREALSIAADTPLLSAADQERYGVSVRNAGDHSDIYYHAGGKDNLIAAVPAGAPAAEVEKKLDAALSTEMTDLSHRYKVSFAASGEDVTRQLTREPSCEYTRGAMIHAKPPTFGDLYAAREALAHSEPSQLAADGKSGIKMYFLDKDFFTGAVYGDKKALAVYINQDKDKKIALYVTPAGEKIPYTALDVPATAIDPKPGSTPPRNLAYVLEHEIAHNSQHVQWKDFPYLPPKLPESFGWQTVNHIEKDNRLAYESYRLNGKNGEGYINAAVDCSKGTAWLTIKDGQYVGADGKLTDDYKQAAQSSNDQVADQAQVRPVTYYFPSPVEEMAEGIASLRSSEATRRRMYELSPQLYAAARAYDDREMQNVYGTDASGQSLYLRRPDGTVTPRNAASQAALDAFENSLKGKP